MTCTIADIVETIDADNNVTPTAGVVVKAEPDRLPIFIDDGGGFREVEDPTRQDTTAADGSWSIKLPKPAEQDPTASKWIITIDDKIAWIGVPPSVDGPVTLHDLKETYGWKLIRRPATAYIQAVQGPKGDPGDAGAPGADGADGTNAQFGYGPGNDGAVVISADTVLTREQFATTFTIDAGKRLSSQGPLSPVDTVTPVFPLEINATSEIVINGILDASGGLSSPAAPGSDGAGGFPGAGGTTATTTPPLGCRGGAGGQGGGGGGIFGSPPGSPGGAPAAAPAEQLVRGSGSGLTAATGGAGGTGDAGGGVGGAGGADPGGQTFRGRYTTLAMLGVFNTFRSNEQVFASMGGSGGGGGGAGDAGGGNYYGGGGGGAGGCSGGAVVLRAPTVTIGPSGVITIAGQDGGRGGNAEAAGVTGAGGGGAGGDGGLLIIVAEVLNNNGGTLVKAGGAGGAPGTGHGGATAATAGSPGAAGEAWWFRPSTGVWTAL